MNSKWETYLAAYNQASPDVKAIIDSDNIVTFVDALCEKYEFDKGKKRNLVIGLSDVILAISTTEDFISNAIATVGISPLYAEIFTADIKSFLDLPSRTPKLTALTTEQPETPGQTAPVLPDSTIDESRPMLNVYTAVKPMRTYSDDVNMSRAHSYGAFRPQEADDEDEQTHSSSQNDLLDRR